MTTGYTASPCRPTARSWWPGYSANGSNNDFALVRYNADGSLDTSFNGDGKVTTAVGIDYDYANAVAVQADGKIIVAGYSKVGATNDFAVVRYHSDGSLDTSFNSDGKLTTDFFGSNDVGNQHGTLQTDGKILVAGLSDSGGVSVDLALARFNAKRQLNTSFDTWMAS